MHSDVTSMGNTWRPGPGCSPVNWCCTFGKMNSWWPILHLQAVLASILLVRVLLQPFFSVRRILVFGLLPTIATSILFFLRGLAVDYRIFWLELQLLEWVCLVGLVYSLLAGLLRSLPGIGRLSRTVWTFTFIISLCTAMGAAAVESQDFFRPQISSLIAAAFVLDRAIFASAGLVLLSVVAFVCWYRIQIARNVAIVGSGFAILLATQIRQVVLGDALLRAGIRIHETSSIVWITILTYWVLFLSSRDENIETRTACTG